MVVFVLYPVLLCSTLADAYKYISQTYFLYENILILIVSSKEIITDEKKYLNSNCMFKRNCYEKYKQICTSFVSLKFVPKGPVLRVMDDLR